MSDCQKQWTEADMDLYDSMPRHCRDLMKEQLCVDSYEIMRFRHTNRHSMPQWELEKHIARAVEIGYRNGIYSATRYLKDIKCRTQSRHSSMERYERPFVPTPPTLSASELRSISLDFAAGPDETATFLQDAFASWKVS